MLQAVYHAVPVLGIPLFGDQFDNVVRAETKGLGVTISPTNITGGLLSFTIQTLIHDTKYVDGRPRSICNSGSMNRWTDLFFLFNPIIFLF